MSRQERSFRNDWDLSHADGGYQQQDFFIPNLKLDRSDRISSVHNLTFQKDQRSGNRAGSSSGRKKSLSSNQTESLHEVLPKSLLARTTPEVTALDRLIQHVNSKHGRKQICVLFLVTLLPSLTYWVLLYVKLAQLRATDKPDDSLDQTASDYEKRNKWEVSQIVTRSLLCVSAMAILLVAASHLATHKSKKARRVLPGLTQVALISLLPPHAFMLPCYPLATGNIVLFVAMSVLNALFVARTQWQLASIFLIVSIFVTMVCYQSSSQLPTDELIEELGLDEREGLLFSVEAQVPFLMHLWLVLAIFCFLLFLASQSILRTMYQLRELGRTDLRHINRMLGFDSDPYLVFEVAHRVGRKSGCKQESGFVLSYISRAFQCLLLNDGATQVEDLLFRLQGDSKSDDAAALQGYGNGDAFLNSSSSGFTNSQNKLAEAAVHKNLAHQPKNKNKLQTLKQLVDGWETSKKDDEWRYFEVSSVSARSAFVSAKSQKVPNNDKSSSESDMGAVNSPMDMLNVTFDRRSRAMIDPFARINSHLPAQYDAQDIEEMNRMLKESPPGEAALLDAGEKSQEPEEQRNLMYVKVALKREMRQGLLYCVVRFQQIDDHDTVSIGRNGAHGLGKYALQSQDASNPFAFKDALRKNGSLSVSNLSQASLHMPQSNKLAADKFASQEHQRSYKDLQRAFKRANAEREHALSALHLVRSQLIKPGQIVSFLDLISFTSQTLRNKNSVASFTVSERSLQVESKQFVGRKNSSFSQFSFAQSEQMVRMRRDSSIKGTSGQTQSLLNVSPSLKLIPGKISAQLEQRKSRMNSFQISNAEQDIENHCEQAKSLLYSLQQALSSASLFLNVIERDLNVDDDTSVSNARVEVMSVLRGLPHDLQEKGLVVRIKDRSNQVEGNMYLWKIFRAQIYHLLLFAVSFSCSERRVYVDLHWHRAHNDLQGEDSDSKHFESLQSIEDCSDPELPDQYYLSSGGEESKSIFLVATVSFQAREGSSRDKKFLANFKKDCNFKRAKTLAAACGGTAFRQMYDNCVVAQLLLPFDYEVIQAALGNDESDKKFWGSKNKRVFQEIKQNLERLCQKCHSRTFKSSPQEANHNVSKSLKKKFVEDGWFNTSSQSESQEASHSSNKQSFDEVVSSKSKPACSDDSNDSANIQKLDQGSSKAVLECSVPQSQSMPERNSNMVAIVSLSPRHRKKLLPYTPQAESFEIPRRPQSQQINLRLAQLSDIEENSLNTIREEQSELEQNSPKWVQKSQHQSKQQPISPHSQRESSRKLCPEPVPVPLLDEISQHQNESCSSYEVSVDLSEEQIGGEESHQMKDKYYRPITKLDVHNPLLLSRNSQKVPELLGLVDKSEIHAPSGKQALSDSVPKRGEQCKILLSSKVKSEDQSDSSISGSKQLQSSGEVPVGSQRQPSSPFLSDIQCDSKSERSERVSQGQQQGNKKQVLFEKIPPLNFKSIPAYQESRIPERSPLSEQKKRNRLKSKSKKREKNESFVIIASKGSVEPCPKFSSAAAHDQLLIMQDKINSNSQRIKGPAARSKSNAFRERLPKLNAKCPETNQLEHQVEAQRAKMSCVIKSGAQSFSESFLESRKYLSGRLKESIQSEQCRCKSSCLYIYSSKSGLSPLKLLLQSVLCNLNFLVSQSVEQGLARFEQDTKKTCHCTPSIQYIFLDLGLSGPNQVESAQEFELICQKVAPDGDGHRPLSPLIFLMTTQAKPETYSLIGHHGIVGLIQTPVEKDELRQHLVAGSLELGAYM